MADICHSVIFSSPCAHLSPLLTIDSSAQRVDVSTILCGSHLCWDWVVIGSHADIDQLLLNRYIYVSGGSLYVVVTFH